MDKSSKRIKPKDSGTHIKIDLFVVWVGGKRKGMITGQYNMLSTLVELHPCNQRKGSNIECKLIILTNCTPLSNMLISGPPCGTSDDSEC